MIVTSPSSGCSHALEEIRSPADSRRPADRPAYWPARRECRARRSIASHSAVVRSRMPSVSTAYSASTLSDRAAMVAKRGSSISARTPIASNSRLHCASLTRDHADVAVLASHTAGDAASACADSRAPSPARSNMPRPTDARPAVNDSIVSSIGTCTSWPSPVRSRWNSAMPIIEASIVPGQLVHHHRRQVARRAVRAGVQRGDAAHALDQVVERRNSCMRAALAEAAGAGVDQPRIARREAGVVQARAARPRRAACCARTRRRHRPAAAAPRAPPAASGRARRCACCGSAWRNSCPCPRCGSARSSGSCRLRASRP